VAEVLFSLFFLLRGKFFERRLSSFFLGTFLLLRRDERRDFLQEESFLFVPPLREVSYTETTGVSFVEEDFPLWRPESLLILS